MRELAIDAELQANCRNAIQINAENLRQILSDNRDTEFGRAHGFAEITDIEEYRRRVPVMQYLDVHPYIERMRAGEENVLTVYPIVSYCNTSGTEGEAKFIPVSHTALERYSNYFERYKNSVLRAAGGKRLLINAFRTDLNKKIEPVSLFSEIYFRYLYESGMMKMDEFIGGVDSIFIEGAEDILYAKVWQAIVVPDFILLECQFLYEMLVFFHYFEANWRKIIDDIRARRIPEQIILPETLRAQLLAMPVSEERLAKVEAECSQGFDNIAKRLWPSLRQVSGVSNRAYRTEAHTLNRYIGDIPQYYLCYCASECYFGAPIRENDFGYVLIPQNAFFEFLPYEADGEAKDALLPHELEEGELYEPIVTNFSGLYRYRLGDVVRVVGFYEQSPIIEFAFRKKQVLNIAGEKIGIRQLEDTIGNLRERGFDVEQYCFGVSLETIPGHYVVAMTLSGKQADPDTLAEALDTSLQECNPDYQDLRGLREILPPEVMLFDSKSYSEFLVAIGLMKRHGHNKPKYIFPGEVSAKKWKECSKQYGK